MGENDILAGINGITIDDTLYDVSFIDGSFNDLYSDSNNLPFTTPEGATQTADSLLATINLFPVFNDFPNLIQGCEDPLVCVFVIPYSLVINSDVNAIIVQTVNDENSNLVDDVFPVQLPADQDLVNLPFAVYAMFNESPPSAVPEPATAALISLSLLGLSGFSRKKKPQLVTAA